MRHFLFFGLFLSILFAACNKNNVEEFDLFMKQFNEDLSFQKSRVIFPLKYEGYDIETDSLMLQEIPEEEWEEVDLSWDPSYKTRETDAYDREIIERKDTTIVHFQVERIGYFYSAPLLERYYDSTLSRCKQWHKP